MKKNTDLGPHRPGNFSLNSSWVKILGDWNPVLYEMFLAHSYGLVGYIKAIYSLFLLSWLVGECTSGRPVIYTIHPYWMGIGTWLVNSSLNRHETFSTWLVVAFLVQTMVFLLAMSILTWSRKRRTVYQMSSEYLDTWSLKWLVIIQRSLPLHYLG